jgi:hypothetical protein
MLTDAHARPHGVRCCSSVVPLLCAPAAPTVTYRTHPHCVIGAGIILYLTRLSDSPAHSHGSSCGLSRSTIVTGGGAADGGNEPSAPSPAPSALSPAASPPPPEHASAPAAGAPGRSRGPDPNSLPHPPAAPGPGLGGDGSAAAAAAAARPATWDGSNPKVRQLMELGAC